MFKDFENLVTSLKRGEISSSEFAEKMLNLSYVDLKHTRIDALRRARTGAPETIFGMGKTPAQILHIADEMTARGSNVLITRLMPDGLEAVKKHLPQAQIFEEARAASIVLKEPKPTKTQIAVVSAGTSDMPVAEEARITAEFLGSRTSTFYDCGVAGLGRLLSVIEEIRKARVVIAVAGMEGALPTVLAGLVKAPVIALPTSVGYGAGLGGLSALLSMINSCANGVSVVNIDNGYGAGYNAHIINSIV